MQTTNRKLTSHMKIVAIMANNRDQTWFFAKDIINKGEGDYYVGYEATARMSELVRKFPDMFESVGEGKFIKRRVRWETMEQWFNQLPTEYRHIIHKTGRTHGVISKNPHASKDDVGPETETKMHKYQAGYVGHSNKLLKNGETYAINMGSLNFGKPISIIAEARGDMAVLTYKNIKEFRKDWRVK